MFEAEVLQHAVDGFVESNQYGAANSWCYVEWGSAFGLDAASGAMQYLEEQTCGFDMQVAYIPIVCGASLFDLSVGDPKCRPDREMGYEACKTVSKMLGKKEITVPVPGASVGKLLGFDKAMKKRTGSVWLAAW